VDRAGEVVAGDGYLPRARTVSLSAVLSQLARKIAREGSWKERLARPRPGARAVVAQIASGEKVVADEKYRAWLRATFSDAVAIENEGFALARAGEVHADAHHRRRARVHRLLLPPEPVPC
jgi:nucleoside phosphorylase